MEDNSLLTDVFGIWNEEQLVHYLHDHGMFLNVQFVLILCSLRLLISL
ncbi:MAG TPA: hypothetical protein VGE58_04550 [Daejeonella sp.]